MNWETISKLWLGSKTIFCGFLLGIILYLHEFGVVSEQFKNFAIGTLAPAIVYYMRRGQDHACATANAQQTETISEMIAAAMERRIEEVKTIGATPKAELAQGTPPSPNGGAKP